MTGEVDIMVLQQIQFPEKLNEQHHLFIRYSDDNCCVDLDNKRITCHSNAELIFNTYYNSFSYSKWSKYTMLSNLFVELKLKGEFEFTFYKLQLKGKTAEQYPVFKKIIRSANSRIAQTVRIELACGMFEGSYSFTLRAIGEAQFRGGYYGTQIDKDKLNDINFALGICTYKREVYVESNLKSLSACVLNKPESPLFGHLKVYIADNGKSLTDHLTKSEKDISLKHGNIKIYDNPNVGGAGGFSRTMLEAMADEEYKPSHIILMDDDVTFTHFALERLFAFLQMLKPDLLKDTLMGGAMLRSDLPWQQHGNGETWSVSGMNFNKINYNLYNVEDILRNEIEEDINQLSWWFFCFPVHEDSMDNLALPLFFQYDDIDFNQRLSNYRKLTLNGVCLLHEPFEAKFSMSKEYYYAIRNRLIICSIHGGTDFTKKFLKSLISEIILNNTLMYRYRCAKLAIRAVEDYLKGLDWLAQQDSEALNKEVSAATYTLCNVEEDAIPSLKTEYEKSLIYREGRIKRIFRKLALNGALLPSKRTVVAPASPYLVVKANLFRSKSVVNYDPYTNKTFCVIRNNWSAIVTCLRYIKCLLLIDIKFKKVIDYNQVYYHQYITSDFWRKNFEK